MTSGDGGKYLPRPDISLPEASPEDIAFAAAFDDLSTTVEGCQRSEQVLLLLSTCRNPYLTVNALFTDLQLLTGMGATPPPYLSAFAALERGDFARAGSFFREMGRTLGQYRQKKKVWQNRVALYDEFAQQLDKLKPAQRDRVRRILSNTTTTGYIWHARYYELCLEDDPGLAAHHALLDSAYEHLSALRVAGSMLCRYATAPPAQLSIFGAVPPATKHGSWLRVCEVIFHAADTAGIRRQEDPNGSVILQPPDGTASITLNPSTPPASAEQRAAVAAFVGSLGRSGGNRVYKRLRDGFSANVARTPMPSTYVVDLSPGRMGRESESAPFRLQTITCGEPLFADNEVTIAVAGINIPTELLNAQDFRFDASQVASIGTAVRKVISTAARSGAKAVVFPEYALPRAEADAAAVVAKEEGVILVGGLEAGWQDGSLVNEAMVAVPGCATNHQRKQYPSVYEERDYRWAGDGEIKLFANSSIGTFAVIICSDLLETNVLRTIVDPSAHPDIVFVPSRNPHPQLFLHLAAADAVRMYTNVVVAPVTESPAARDGLAVARPSRTSGFDFGSLVPIEDDQWAYGIYLFRISLDAIAARRRNKPADGFFSPPFSARPS